MNCIQFIFFAVIGLGIKSNIVIVNNQYGIINNNHNAMLTMINYNNQIADYIDCRSSDRLL